MTWETKLGLLVGMGVIILIGILISDHLSQAQRQQQARLDRSLPELEEDPLPAPFDPQSQEQEAASAGDASGSAPSLPPANRRSGGDAASGRADAGSSEAPEPPDTIRQEIQPERAYSTGPSEPSSSSSQPGGSERPDTDSSDPLPEGFTRVEGPGAQSSSQTDSDGNGDGGNASASNTDSAGGSSSNQSNGSASEREESNERESEPEKIVHHVKKGETLYDIARQYYDNPNYWKTILEANRSRIPSAGALRPGVRLVIPNKAGRANTPGNSQASAGSDGNATRTYKVQRGDSLSQIAERLLGSSGAWRKLHQLNKDRIEDPNSMKPGIVLRVPSR